MTNIFATVEDPVRPSLKVLEGRIKRVDYQKREMFILSEMQVWRLRVPPDCRLWFDNQPAILRCFHPLDPVRVAVVEEQPDSHAVQIESWA